LAEVFRQRRPQTEAGRAGQGSFTLAVSDIDAVAENLQRLGIDTSNRMPGRWVATLMITDQDGNHIAFAEAFDKGMAR
jgi:hypothetical protein